MLTCDFCGCQADEGAATLTWSFAMENDRKMAFCEQCSRQNVRAMEGKLDSEYW